VARIVEACTDGTAEAKADHTDPEARRQDWLRRKQAYLQHLAEADDEVLLVSGCDKLHNARALVQDLEDPAVGEAVFGRFTGGREGTVWYYGALRDLFRARGAATAVHLQRLVAALEAGAGSAPGQGASHGAGR
jgi:hypothetical protein